MHPAQEVSDANVSGEAARPPTQLDRPANDSLVVDVITTFAETEEVRGFWTRHCRHRDADLDFYQLIVSSRPGASPFILHIRRGEESVALLVGRIERVRVAAQAGYLRLPTPRLRTLELIHGGNLGGIGGEESDLVYAYLRRMLRGGTIQVVRLHYADLTSPLARRFATHSGILTRDRCRHEAPHWVRDLTRFASFDASVSKRTRTKQRHREKLIASAFSKWDIAVMDDPCMLPQLIRAAEQIASSSYQRGLQVGFVDCQATRQRLEFLAKRGWLRARVLWLGGQPVAHWIGAVYRNTFFLDYLAFDPMYSRFEPGTFLALKFLEELHRPGSGCEIVDFGFGDAKYKERFSNLVIQHTTIHLFAPTISAISANATRTVLQALTQSVRALLVRTGAFEPVRRVLRGNFRPLRRPDSRSAPACPPRSDE